MEIYKTLARSLYTTSTDPELLVISYGDAYIAKYIPSWVPDWKDAGL